MPGESPAGEFQALFLYLQHPRSKVSAGKTKRRVLTAYLGGPPKRQELSPLWQTIRGVNKCLQPKEAHVPPKNSPGGPGLSGGTANTEFAEKPPLVGPRGEPRRGAAFPPQGRDALGKEDTGKVAWPRGSRTSRSQAAAGPATPPQAQPGVPPGLTPPPHFQEPSLLSFDTSRTL